jgi:hypothetical protein
MGLERLVFFSQCRHYGFYGSLLYPEKSYKRHTAPVSYELMALHEGKYLARVEDIGMYAGGLKTQEKEVCDWVLANFGGGLWKECMEWNLTGYGEEISMEDIKRIASLLSTSTPPTKLKGQLFERRLMPNQKRKQEAIEIELDALTSKKIEELGKALKALMYEKPTNCCILPADVTFPDIKRAFLTAEDLHSDPLWHFLRMQGGNRYNRDLWWAYAGCDAFGWWEGENPFKGFIASDDFDEDITYLKSLDYKVAKEEKKGYSKPQDDMACFVVTDIEDALSALENIADSFALEYEDGCVKLWARNKENPDFRACLMMAYRWKEWCDWYRYSKEMERVLEYSYGIKTPDPIFKDGKLVFGDEFEKTPEEFVYDLATLEPSDED